MSEVTVTTRKSSLESVSGFNSPQSFVKRVVEFSVTFGSVPCGLQAVVAPELRTSPKLPGLASVVQTFVQLGYKLADQSALNYGDEISEKI
jgi:hypothetical protein